ncbi:MAG: glycosyltransferase family 39 protein [Candidatus Dormibacteraeota bacterium]|nr:glycosyltransferase family 39 protein [Candidatus Dormibacteraeota bacterium]
MGAVLVIAAILRTFRLDTFPPGLYADVAANGIDALGVPGHGLQVIYPRGSGNGIEGMISWLDAISVGLVGNQPIALYLTTVVIGLLTLPIHYLLASRLFGRRVGLISTALLAVSFWAVHYSRLGYRTALVPLLLDLAFLSIWWAARRSGAWRWALAGVATGVGTYTYTSYRLVVLVVGGLILLRLLARRTVPGSPSSWATYLLAAAVVATPLAIATLQNPDILNRDIGVSVFRAGPVAELPGRLLDHTVRTIAAFNLWGDPERQYNVPHLPLFDPLVGLAFLAGIVVAIKRWRESRYALLLLWLGVFTMVVALSDRTPHMLRGSGLIPAAYLLAAVGLDAVLQKLRPRRAALAAAAVCAISLAWTAAFYFAVYPTVPGLYLEFMGDKVDVGRFMNATQWNGRHVYVAITFTNRGTVTPDTFRAIPIRYVTAGHVDWTFLDYRQAGDLPGDVPIAVVFDARDRLVLDRLAERFPDGGVAYVLPLSQRPAAVFLHGDAGAFHPAASQLYSNW